MIREFPDIVNLGSAFRFALEAEQAAAAYAAAAVELAPDDTWRDRLEEVVRGHGLRTTKLMALRQEVNEMTLEPLDGLDASAFVAVLTAAPATSWRAAVEQLAAVEEAVAGFHEAFVAHAEDVLAAQTRAFTRAARQERATAEVLRALLP